MLEVENLTFSYGRKGQMVLDHLSFKTGKGQLIAVLGPNGAGKSTLFKCMLGFLKGYEGSIRMDGVDIRSLSRREMALLAAYIPQSEVPVYNYTVLDSVLMGTTGTLSPLRSPGEEQLERARAALKYLGVDHMENRGIVELSGGERQLVMLARAIAQNAKLMIMDEPTANLDYGNQQLVMHHVKKMARSGYTIMLSTHNPEHAIAYATNILAIKDHKILADGPTEVVLTEALIEKIYGMRVKIMDISIDGKPVRSCIPLPADVTD